MLSDLYKIRAKKNLTQQALADLSGVAKSTIGQIENGQSIPRIDTVCKLALALDMPAITLFAILCEGEDFSYADIGGRVRRK